MDDLTLTIISFATVFFLPIQFLFPVASCFFSPPPKISRSRSLHGYIFQDDSNYAGATESSALNSTLIEASFNECHTHMPSAQIDITGPGTLGDIMAGPIISEGYYNNLRNAKNLSQSAIIDGLVTKEGGELNEKFGCKFTPMERIAITANGNLQRIFSSYYDAPVHVHVDSCCRRAMTIENNKNENDNAKSEPNMSDYWLEKYSYRINSDGVLWDRAVHLHIHGKMICRAKSVINIRSSECIRLIDDGSVGIGQLFRFLNKLPIFSLLAAGRTNMPEDAPYSQSFDATEMQDGIWRTYELRCEEITCLIHEEFHRNAWNINPNDNQFLSNHLH